SATNRPRCSTRPPPRPSRPCCPPRRREGWGCCGSATTTRCSPTRRTRWSGSTTCNRPGPSSPELARSGPATRDGGGAACCARPGGLLVVTTTGLVVVLHQILLGAPTTHPHQAEQLPARTAIAQVRVLRRRL